MGAYHYRCTHFSFPQGPDRTVQRCSRFGYCRLLPRFRGSSSFLCCIFSVQIDILLPIIKKTEGHDIKGDRRHCDELSSSYCIEPNRCGILSFSISYLTSLIPPNNTPPRGNNTERHECPRQGPPRLQPAGPYFSPPVCLVPS
jgi:hypothetical protein